MLYESASRLVNQSTSIKCIVQIQQVNDRSVDELIQDCHLLGLQLYELDIQAMAVDALENCFPVKLSFSTHCEEQLRFLFDSIEHQSFFIVEGAFTFLTGESRQVVLQDPDFLNLPQRYQEDAQQMFAASAA